MPKFKPYKSTFNLHGTQIGTKMKNDPKYDALRNLDNHSESSTEVEEWDPESDVRPRRRKKGFWAKVKAWRWVIDTALLLVIFVLLAEKRWKSHKHHKSHRYELAGDLTGFAPQCTFD